MMLPVALQIKKNSFQEMLSSNVVVEYQSGSGAAIALKIPIPYYKSLRIWLVVIHLWKKTLQNLKNRLDFENYF